MAEQQVNDMNRILQGICDLPMSLFEPPEDAYKYQMVLTHVYSAAGDDLWVGLDGFLGATGLNPEIFLPVVWQLTVKGFLALSISERDDCWVIRFHPKLKAYIEHGAPEAEVEAYGLGVVGKEEPEEEVEEFRAMNPTQPLHPQLLDSLGRIDSLDHITVADVDERRFLDELAEIADDFPDNLSLFEIVKRLEEPQRTRLMKLGAALVRMQAERQYQHREPNA